MKITDKLFARFCSKTGVGAAIVALGLMTQSPAMASDCSALLGRSFDDAQVIETEEVSAPITLTSLDVLANGPVRVDSPFCRVRGLIRASSDSNISFEVWLPPQAQWNGRYQGIGNGGFAGSMIYRSMERGLASGYVVSGTDTGHVGLMQELSWGLNHPERIVDLGWRSIYETARASKAIVEAHYGSPASRSYFVGCSTGGRQGLLLAQRFPDLYDGYVVGAPAIYWPALLASGGQTVQRVLADRNRWLSREKVALLNDAVLAACGEGATYVADPGRCRFDPATLACSAGSSTDACLTPGELASVRDIYAGLRRADGSTIYPGFAPGSERGWNGALMGPSENPGLGAGTYPFPSGFYGNFVYQSAAWRLSQFDAARDLPVAIESPAGQAVFAENPDLSAFRARGGRIIQYHGLNEQAIPPGASVMYYEAVGARMGGLRNISSFYRLFLAPGMEHCGSGPGPNAVGGVFGGPAPSDDPEHNVVAALSHWVEDGVAPTRIIATHYRQNDPAQGVETQRPWCVYPSVARYNGRGDRNAAASYTCRRP